MIKKAPSQYDAARTRLMKIMDGMEDGMPLPNRTKLAEALGVSRITLERVISALKGEGLLRSRVGSGTYVTRVSDPRTNEHPIHGPGFVRDEKTWALIISSVTHFSYPLLIRGCEGYANEQGINLIICNTDNLIAKQDEYLNKLINTAVSGIIIVPARGRGTNWKLFDQVIGEGISVVTCNRQVPGYEFPSVLMNFYQSGLIATMHLIEMGCRRIAFIATPHYSTVLQRYQGYLSALDAHGMGENPLALYLQDPEINLSETCVRQIEAFLHENPDIDGIFSFNDSVAQVIYAALKSLGLTPGRDVRIVSCDNTEVCELLTPPLSSIVFPNYQMGRYAGELLKRLRDGESEEQLPRITLNARLVARASSLGETRGAQTANTIFREGGQHL